MVKKSQGSLKKIVGDKIYSVWVDMFHRLVPDGRTHCLASTIASRGDVLDIVPHPQQSKYHRQKMFIINIEDYAYLVPFVESEDIIFLKTIIPSRKATKKYLRGDRHENKGRR